MIALQRQLNASYHLERENTKFNHEIQHNICEGAQRSSLLGNTFDSSTDVSACEQFLCKVQFVNTSSVPHYVFLSFYYVQDSTVQTFFW